MTDPGMASYGFMNGSAPGGRHYYSADRFAAFFREFLRRDWQGLVEIVPTSPAAKPMELSRFHPREYLDDIASCIALGEGSFDHGPTPVEPGIEQAAARVVGTVLHAARLVEMGLSQTAFVPISGFHHAGPEETRDYCLYNDPAVLLSTWLLEHPDEKIAYVDVDAHFGNGVYDRFCEDPRVLLVDIHQDSRTFWYSDGNEEEPGTLTTDSVRLSCLPGGVGDAEYLAVWNEHLTAIKAFEPKRVLYLAGADMLRNDGLGEFDCSIETLQTITHHLDILVRSNPEFHMVVLGAGGYSLRQLGPAWCGVLEALTGLHQLRNR